MKIAIAAGIVVLFAGVVGLARFRGSRPGDCDPVAEQLASYELGNYAELEERAPVVAKHRARCQEQEITVDEVACLDKARTRAAAAGCARRLFPELVDVKCSDAAAAVALMWGYARSNIEPTMKARLVDATTRSLQKSCEDDAWSDELKVCIAVNRGSADFGACGLLYTPEQTRKLSERMSAAVTEATR